MMSQLQRSNPQQQSSEATVQISLSKKLEKYIAPLSQKSGVSQTPPRTPPPHVAIRTPTPSPRFRISSGYDIRTIKQHVEPFPVEFCFSPSDSMKPTNVSEFMVRRNSGILDIFETSLEPVYYHFKHVIMNDTIYNALYYSIFFTESFSPDGKHPVTQRIVILFNEQARPEWVFFGAQDNGQGLWVPWSDCEKTSEDGVLRVFVAPKTHAFYPRARTYLRNFGLSNDVTTNTGKHWRPRKMDFQPSSSQSWSRTYEYIVDGVKTPKCVDDPECTSISPLQRFALPITKGKLSRAKKISIIPPLARSSYLTSAMASNTPPRSPRGGSWTHASDLFAARFNLAM